MRQVPRGVRVPRRAAGWWPTRALALGVVVAALSACGPAGAAPSATAPASVGPSPRPTATLLPAVEIPTAAFAAMPATPLPAATAAKFQAALEKMAAGQGMTATVITAEGIWSGATGKADGVADLAVDSQFGIASVTKSVVAAQVMRMAEAGELSLDEPASEYLPAGFVFDTNGATIRQLLSHRSGIPDWYGDSMEANVAKDRGRAWTTAEVLALVPPRRSPPDSMFLYADTNYTLLGLVIEAIRKRPLASVLRDGVLGVKGTERLVYQPDETPSAPIALPLGEPASSFAPGLGYLPSMSDASSAGPAGSIASDAISLARWWRAFCAGEVVSPASLAEMSRYYDGRDGYGLGLFNPVDGYGGGIGMGVGHQGSNFGYASWAGCLTAPRAVVVILTNQWVDNIGGMAEPLVDALR